MESKEEERRTYANASWWAGNLFLLALIFYLFSYDVDLTFYMISCSIIFFYILSAIIAPRKKKLADDVKQ